MSRIPEEPISDAYYAAFYKAILNGFASNDTTIIQAILQNSKRLFSFPLPGLHILIPPFIGAIERQLLSDTLQDVSCDVKRSCITILGSLVAVSNRLKDVTIELVDEMEWISERYQGKVFAFNDIKVWLKNIFIRLVSVGMQVPQTEEDTDIHCMLLGALCALAMDELLASEK
jgi:hypothetical protein